MLLFTGAIVLITSVSLYLAGDFSSPNSFSHTFQLSENMGPIYIEYGPETNYKEFLYKVHQNTHWWHINGKWVNQPSVGFNWSTYQFRSTLNDNSINAITLNYNYPILRKTLPLGQTYFGCLDLANLTSIENKKTYSSFFVDGVFSVYSRVNNKIVLLNSHEEPAFSGAVLEWYRSWEDLAEFNLYRHLYFPIDRDRSGWVVLYQLMKSTYPHPSTVPCDETWESLCEASSFSTFDFMEFGDKVNLFSIDPSIWMDDFTPCQAIFRYYDVVTGEIGFWTPKDLILNHEAIRISRLLNKQPEEVVALFHNWLFKPGAPNHLYFNYTGAEGYDYVFDPYHEIEYVC